MGSSTIPSLQLPTLTPLEPLTKGTDLPQVELESLPSPPASPPLKKGANSAESYPKPVTPPPHPTATISKSATSPPNSPTPASMRRFLSRVSLNSSYANNSDDIVGPDDKVSIFSAPSSENKQKQKKTSWWKKAKRHSTILTSSTVIQENIENSNPVVAKGKTVQAIPPPPRLPEDIFSKNLSSLDDDMFKNFNSK